MDFITIYNFPPLISSILFLILGFLVFIKNKKSKINKKFLIICFATFWWQFSWFILFSIKDEVLAGYLVRIGYVGIIFIPITFFHYFISFLDSVRQIDKYILRFSYILGSVFTIILFSSDLFISGFYQYFWGFYPKAGIIHPVYLFFLCVLAIRIFYISLVNLKSKKSTSSYKYYQIKLILWALGFYILSAVDFVVNYGYEIYPFGFLFIIIFLGIIAYTIITHRLMDIKFVLRKSFIFLTSLSTILIFAVSAQYVFYRFFVKISVWADFIILILSISFFPLMNKYYYRLANKYFFTSLYDTQTVIMKLSDKLRSTMELKKIYKFISDAFIRSFHAKAVGVLLYNEKAGSYMLKYNKGFNFGKRNKFSFLKQLKKMCESKSDSIIVEELRHSDYNKYKEIIKKLDGFNIEILTPLNIKGKNIGFIVLGHKESKDPYNNEDLRVLKIAGAQVAIVVENAILYEETKQFNIKLKEEIKQATDKLRSANKKLKKLDVAKSDFISIASHQLRTPLTVIKGYISMILEGAFGKLNKKEVDSLKKVYESNERLIKLVENLLNISRVESGRLKFDFQEERLEKIADSVTKELFISAKKKGVKLNYKKPKKSLAKVKIDGEKIRQVILNLIDNSIKYTKEGAVNVFLKQTDSNIHFCVSDTGMGIIKEDLPRLFKKFSRGKGTSLIHAGGSGLGLYVCKIMVEAHKGKIWCKSNGKGKGAEFCFRLPISI